MFETKNKENYGEKKSGKLEIEPEAVLQAVDDHFSILCVRFKFPCGSNLNLFFFPEAA